jgi:DNA-directed RNA polymerase specialized sigma24 family protein
VHVDGLLGFFCRHTRDAELAADLTAETFAAALGTRRRFRPEAGSATAWLYGIATNQDSLRGTERLTAVDVGTGRTITATSLKDFGAGWLTPVGENLWLIAPTGYAVVVKP